MFAVMVPAAEWPQEYAGPPAVGQRSMDALGKLDQLAAQAYRKASLTEGPLCQGELAAVHEVCAAAMVALEVDPPFNPAADFFQECARLAAAL